ncbi:hypothetical protein IKF28_00425 [Candidatus Saccharibacteria bacterium]|nr:hypothetical protein [Candidatus Saccharibacteria bacterium]MBR3121896.1 hypothetical protein [Candidatus Saccharibacteria bacterium]
MCDERIIALKKLNISESAAKLTEKVGYDKMKEYTKEGSKPVLTQEVKQWFQKCPNMREFSFYFARSHGEPEPTEDKVIEDLICSAKFKDFSFIMAHACHLCKSQLQDLKTEMPDFLEELYGAIFNEDRVYCCAEKTLVELCDSYFDEISEYMDYLEG